MKKQKRKKKKKKERKRLQRLVIYAFNKSTNAFQLISGNAFQKKKLISGNEPAFYHISIKERERKALIILTKSLDPRI